MGGCLSSSQQQQQQQQQQQSSGAAQAGKGALGQAHKAEPRFTNLTSTTGNAAVTAATAAVKQHGQQQNAVTKPAPAPPASMDGRRMGSCKALGGALAHGAHALDEDSEHESPSPGTVAAVAGAGPSSSGEMASSNQGSTLSRAGSPLPSGLVPAAAAAAAAVAGKPGRSSVTVSAPPLLPTAAPFAVPASPWAPALTTAAAPHATNTTAPSPVNVATDATARMDRGGRASGAPPSAAPIAAAPANTPVATKAEAETSAASAKSRSIAPTTATSASTAVADGAPTKSRGVAGAARPSIQAFAASGRFVAKPDVPPAVKGAPKVEERWECVLHKFDAVQEGELSLAPGAWVQVLDHHDDGWLTVSTADGETGLVPRSYVTSTRLTKPLTPKA